MKLTKEQLLGMVRHGVTFIGGIFVTRGLIDDSILTEVMGAAVTLSSVIWSIVAKNKA